MNDLFTYIERLELIAFFAAFPLVYFGVLSIQSPKPYFQKLPAYLPKGYALTSLLYIGMKMYQEYNRSAPFEFSNLFLGENRFFIIWAYTGIILGIPLWKPKPIFALLHSLVFLYLFLQYVWLFIRGVVDSDVLKNGSQLLFYGLLLNCITLLLVTTLGYLFHRFLKKNAS